MKYQPACRLMADQLGFINGRLNIDDSTVYVIYDDTRLSLKVFDGFLQVRTIFLRDDVDMHKHVKAIREEFGPKVYN